MRRSSPLLSLNRTFPATLLMLAAGCATPLDGERIDSVEDELATSGVYQLVHVKGGKCAHFSGDSAQNGTSAELYTCDAGYGYSFALEPSGSGYQLRNVLTNRCLDLSNASKTAGASVIEYSCNGLANQRFVLESVTPEVYRLRFAHSGQVLSTASGGKRSGTKLVQSEYYGGAHQHWELVTAALPPVASITPSIRHQSIDGFGMSTAWGSLPSSGLIDAFFSVSKGAGLSIVRNRIPFNESPKNHDHFLQPGNYAPTIVNANTANQHKVFPLNWGNWDLSGTRKLIAILKASSDYDVRSYFSTPWTPPNNSTSRWKLGVKDYVNAPEIGGYLDPAHYADYADLLADYALGFETNMGAPLAAISLQNEPNYQANYESADFSASQFHDFIAVLKKEFAKKGLSQKLPKLNVIAPEDPGFSEALLLPTLADANTASAIGIVGVHQYDFGPWNETNYVWKPLAQSAAKGKRVWMTEWSTAAFDGDTIDTNLTLARVIHEDLTKANLNAFVYWWTSSLVSGSTPTRKLSTLGQFSRFIRPGWQRIGAASPTSGVLVSAFQDPTGKKTATVAVNRTTTPQTISLVVSGKKFTKIVPYRTSATEAMAALEAIPGGASRVTVVLAPKSITTFAADVSP